MGLRDLVVPRQSTVWATIPKSTRREIIKSALLRLRNSYWPFVGITAVALVPSAIWWVVLSTIEQMAGQAADEPLLTPTDVAAMERNLAAMNRMMDASACIFPVAALLAGLFALKLFLMPCVFSVMKERGFEVCRKCGYCLTGLPAEVPRCPECGKKRS